MIYKVVAMLRALALDNCDIAACRSCCVNGRACAERIVPQVLASVGDDVMGVVARPEEDVIYIDVAGPVLRQRKCLGVG